MCTEVWLCTLAWFCAAEAMARGLVKGENDLGLRFSADGSSFVSGEVAIRLMLWNHTTPH